MARDLTYTPGGTAGTVRIGITSDAERDISVEDDAREAIQSIAEAAGLKVTIEDGSE